MHSVTPSFCWGGGRLNFQPNFQKGGGSLTGHQLLEGGCWKRGGWLFLGGGGGGVAIFAKKIKYEIFYDKKRL